MAEPQIGLITEVGDLGLGFDPLSKKDQETINESFKQKEDKKEKDKESK